jgi:branched-subunit amino acid aminotransferase/4-amino-4-deoxychorismate lyase
MSQPDIRWERCDIKTIALLPNVLAKQAARESGGLRGVADRRQRLHHRGRLDQRLGS